MRLLRSRVRGVRLLLACIAVTVAVALVGCAATDLLAYTGGGLPPGDGDIGGLVLAATGTATTATAAQAGTVPVPDATVVLYRGTTEVGRTQTGPQGYFRFEKPATGTYQVRVQPPAGSGLREAQRQFQHRRGQQSFLTILLERQ